MDIGPEGAGQGPKRGEDRAGGAALSGGTTGSQSGADQALRAYAGTTPKGTVLLVDGDPCACQSIQTHLSPRLIVHTAGTVLEARETIRSHAFDLVFLEYRLPDGDGTDLLRLVKQISPSTMVIMMAAGGSEDTAVEAFRLGARDYLRKPIDGADLRRRVGALMRIHHASAEPRENLYVRETDPAYRRIAAQPPPDVPARARSIQKAMQHIRENLAADHTLADEARTAGMSKFHFCRSFKEFSGLTVREFLVQARVARAKELLQDPQRSVTEICYEAGFNDLSHFSRTFRNTTGISATAYRHLAAPRHRPPEGSGVPFFPS